MHDRSRVVRELPPDAHPVGEVAPGPAGAEGRLAPRAADSGELPLAPAEAAERRVEEGEEGEQRGQPRQDQQRQRDAVVLVAVDRLRRGRGTRRLGRRRGARRRRGGGRDRRDLRVQRGDVLARRRVRRSATVVVAAGRRRDRAERVVGVGGRRRRRRARGRGGGGRRRRGGRVGRGGGGRLRAVLLLELLDRGLEGRAQVGGLDVLLGGEVVERPLERLPGVV